jgi:hypothetical protein
MAMMESVVNNPNIFFDASDGVADATLGRRGHDGEPRPEADASLLRQVGHIRRQIEETACSSTWAEDWLYRGADYSPDFQCKCIACRTLFPERLHPRSVRESDYSADCQIETNEDPEFAEELAKLRNDRPRYGSIFVKGTTKSIGRGYSRSMRSSGANA